MKTKKTKLKSVKPQVFKFKQGEMWDGDEQIIEWIMDKLKVCDENNWTVEQDTYFVIHGFRRLNI